MIKKLASCVGRYKKDAILTPIMVAFEVVLEVLIPFLMSLMIDNGINKGDMGYIWKMGGILIVAAMVALIFGALAGVGGYGWMPYFAMGICAMMAVLFNIQKKIVETKAKTD